MGGIRTRPRRKRKAPCYIFEGVWWHTREVPQVLPYLQALAATVTGLDLSHRTFRSADDLGYWLRRIPKGERSFVYVACHASNGDLYPADGRSCVAWDTVLAALRGAKPDAIEFLHFGSCEIVEEKNRRRRLEGLADASGARWVSGYVHEVDWLPSMLLDIALVGELFLPFYHETSTRRPQMRARAQWFVDSYEQLARVLGFSGLARNLAGVDALIPARLRP
jgi:hypothetical protein